MSEKVTRRYIRQCDPSVALNRSKDYELNELLESANAAAVSAPEDWGSLQDEAPSIVFNGGSYASFDDFEDDKESRKQCSNVATQSHGARPTQTENLT